MSLPITLGEALQMARGRIDSVDAKVLLREASGCNAAVLIGFPERAMSPEAASRYVDWVSRREAGEPVAHLTGCREFYGHLFRVTPDTLIPRPDTELLVELALALLAHEPLSRPPVTLSPSEREQQGVAPNVQASQMAVPQASLMPPSVLDLGTGTGAIAISIALTSDANVTAIDASSAALKVAEGNAKRLSAKLRCLHGSWFEPVANERFDLIVSNPPYIAADDHHLSEGDVRFEPLSALVAGPDGLDDIRHIISQSPTHLASTGWLLLEHGYDQAEAVCDLLAIAGFIEIQSWRDLAGIERVSGGRLDY